MTLKLSCSLATYTDSPEHARIAEALGYHRAWFYDSPALYPDVWVSIALAAERTSTIGLGPGVLVPALRHPMVNAAAIATIADLAPGRLAVAVGSGFTGARTLGQKPMAWAKVGAYIATLRGLLAGQEVVWEGNVLKMMHPDGFGPARPLDVPFFVAASGPKGMAVAAEVGDGVMVAGNPAGVDAFRASAMLMAGTVLLPGEAVDSERVMAAAGHAAAVNLHAVYEWYPAMIESLPGGAAWRDAIEQVPEARRHLELHDLHLIGVTERDRPFLTAEALAGVTFTPEALRERAAGWEAAGLQEVAYQPAGPDIAGELERFATALHG